MQRCELSGATGTVHHEPGASATDFTAEAWGLEVQDQEVSWLVSPEDCEQKSVPASPPTSGDLLAILGIPGLVEASPQTLPPCPQARGSQCLNFPFL